MPVWSTGESPVKNTVHMLVDKKIIKQEEFNVIFEELIHIKTYLKNQPLTDGKSIFDIWNEKHVKLEQRWLKIFADLRSKSVSYRVFAKIIEYVLMIPATNCDCERIFSLMKNYWTDKKSALTLGTLKSWLMVKNNSQMECLDFHKFISNKPDYLKKV